MGGIEYEIGLFLEKKKGHRKGRQIGWIKQKFVCIYLFIFYKYIWTEYLQ